MKKKIYCGFCGRSSDSVKKLIKGPITNICDECIEFSVKILEADSENDRWKAEQARLKEGKKTQT